MDRARRFAGFPARHRRHGGSRSTSAPDGARAGLTSRRGVDFEQAFEAYSRGVWARARDGQAHD